MIHGRCSIEQSAKIQQYPGKSKPPLGFDIPCFHNFYANMVEWYCFLNQSFLFSIGKPSQFHACWLHHRSSSHKIVSAHGRTVSKIGLSKNHLSHAFLSNNEEEAWKIQDIRLTHHNIKMSENFQLGQVDGSFAISLWGFLKMAHGPEKRETYRQISNISCTKSQNLNVSCLVLHLSLPSLLKPCIKLRMKM